MNISLRKSSICAVIFAFTLVGVVHAKVTSLTTDGYVQAFFHYFNMAPEPLESSFLQKIPDGQLGEEYSSLGSIVPNRHFDGKQWQVDRGALVTRAEAVKSLVRYTQVVLPSEIWAPVYLSKIGFNPETHGYSDRYVLYLATFLCHSHLAGNADALRLMSNAPINESDANRLFRYAKGIAAHPDYKDCPKGQNENTQPYFPDGPMFIGSDVKVKTPSNSVFHQYSGIRGSAVTNNDAVNGVGVWGESHSLDDKGHVWGGFFTATGPNDPNKDSQLVGTEIDVINKGKPGISPNQSKVGLQIVSIGTSNSTSAIEVISDNKSKWGNGLAISENAIAPNGAVIGLSQHSPMRAGLDFGAGHFTDAAIRIGNNQIIRFDDSSNDNAAAYIKNDKNNFLSIVPGRAGLVIRNNTNTENMLEITAAGDVVFERATPVLTSPSGQRFALSVDNNGNLHTSPLQ